MTTTYRAQWIFPINSPPIENGTITIDRDRIVVVEGAGRRTADEDWGNVAVLPGFVNAHVHLDLTGLRDKAPPSLPLPNWLSQVIQHRRGVSEDDIQQDVQRGLQESIAHGVTMLCDVAGQGQSWAILETAPIRSIVCYELLGLPEDRADRTWTELLAWLAARPANVNCHPGLSPHAPYSVRRSLFERAAALAAERSLPLTVHLAESREELQLLSENAGPFRAFLEAVGVWDPQGLVDSVEEVVTLHKDVDNVLFAHGNYLEAATFSSALQGGTIVYCPRTHARFGHSPHPIGEMLAGGARVVLGTDSLASNPDLSVLEEARFLRSRRADLCGEALLRMITLSPAESLGWDHEIGSLETGKSADLVLVPPTQLESDDPCDRVLRSKSAPSAVMCQGQWVHRKSDTFSGG